MLVGFPKVVQIKVGLKYKIFYSQTQQNGYVWTDSITKEVVHVIGFDIFSHKVYFTPNLFWWWFQTLIMVCTALLVSHNI